MKVMPSVFPEEWHNISELMDNSRAKTWYEPKAGEVAILRRGYWTGSTKVRPDGEKRQEEEAQSTREMEMMFEREAETQGS